MSYQKKSRRYQSFQPVFFKIVNKRIFPSVFLLLACVPWFCVSCRKEPAKETALPLVGARAPEWPSDLTWLNTPFPKTIAQSNANATLLFFWSSTSINSLRAVKQVNLWHRKYSEFGLEMVGVHAPQFSFEKDSTVVQNSISREVMLYPVVLDNDFKIWSAYRNRAWPAFYLIDQRGVIRDIFVGETEFEQLELRIQDLLAEAGVAPPESLGTVPSEADFEQIGTPQILVGYDELSHFGSPEPVALDAVQTYSADSTLVFNHFYLVGDWEIQKEKILLRSNGGKLLLRFEASRVYVVLGSLHNSRLRAEVRLDGEPLITDNYGKDIWFRDGRSYVEIDNRRMYELVDTRGIYGEYTLEISFLSADTEIFSLMFG